MVEVDGRKLDMSPRAMEACEEHSFSRVDVEVGGFLLGSVDDRSVTISRIQPAATAESSQTNLTFTHEAWDEVLSKLDSEFKGLSIVGWYHSHPGFGCFLSEYDIFIQQNFFSGPGQIALVIDPLAGTYGYFVASDGNYQELGSGSTQRTALARGDAPDFAEAKADIVNRSQGAKQNVRRWPVGVAAGIVAFGVGLGIGWLAIGIPSQDAQRSATNALAASESEVESLESQLRESEATVEQLRQEDDVIEPTPEPTSQPADPAGETAVPEEPEIEVVEESASVLVAFPIRAGDTLWGIAERLLGEGQRYTEIVELNPGIDPRGLNPGDVIRIELPRAPSEEE